MTNLNGNFYFLSIYYFYLCERLLALATSVAVYQFEFFLRPPVILAVDVVVLVRLLFYNPFRLRHASKKTLSV